MKQFILTILFFYSFLNSFSQSTNQNYIQKTIFKIPVEIVPESYGMDGNGNLIVYPAYLPLVDDEDKIVTISYFDGLGRQNQQISYKQSATGKDIVVHMEYDQFGRQVDDYLPFVSQSAPSLNYQTNAGSEVLSFYSTNNPTLTGNPFFETTTNPKSSKLLENSPLNRVLKQGAPGNDWTLGSNNEIKFEYKANVSTDQVKLFKANTSWDTTLKIYNPTLAQNGFYSINQLYKFITKDENWKTSDGSKFTTEEFKNKEGQVVLKRTYNLVNSTVEKHDTYYVYDQYGNLTYVLPPLASEQSTITQTILDNLCYQYKYDYRNRLVEKKLPGKQWEFIVYDKLDRVVATGPAKAPFSGFIYDGWLVNKYDAFNRTVYTAWYQYVSTPDGFDSTIRKNFQNIINSNTTLSENRLNQQITMIDNIQTEYSNQVIPNTGLKLLSVNYYDVYSPLFSPNPLPTIIEGQNIITNVKGLPISSWVRVLEDENSTNGEQSYTLYDNKYRPVRSYTKNYLGGYTQVDSNIDWAGKTVYTLTKHKRIDTNTELTVKDMFSYSDQDKLLIHKQQINSNAEQLITSNTYDELGQLISKKVGGTDVSGATGLQKVDYNYNIRGWLKGINDIDDIVTENDLFAFKINYNDPETAQPLFNGNIAETLWKTSADNKERKYNYTYDHLNRLLQADYAKNGSVSFNSYLEAMTYDKNGNILTLVRNGDNDTDGLTTVNNIDNLTYTYDTNNKNQLLKVFDTSSNPQGFKDNTDGITDTTTDDYSYDANGNLIRDDNKGITLIEYNHLNLPTKITFGTNGFIEYLYNALGQKVKKMVLDPNAPPSGDIGAPLGVTTDYLSGFQYKNGILQFFPHAEGYVNATATIPPFGGEATYDFNYVYNYTDHLGNIRLSYSVDPASQEVKIMEENHYYPFGLKHTNYNSDWLIYGRQNESTVLKKPGPIVKYEPVYKYKYQSQERQDELGLNWDSFKYRNYDYAIGRFMCIDPLAEDYSYQSPYNFSENRVIDGVELEGLERWPVNGGGVDSAVISKIGQEPTTPQKTENQGNVIKGTGNIFFGIIGAISSVVYIGGTDGAGAALGGVVALELSLGEIAIGAGQINDAFTNNSENTDLQNSNTIPGLIANKNDSSYSKLIDGMGAFVPGLLSGGNLKAILDTPSNIRNSTNAGEVFFNTASGLDAVLDTQAVIEGALNPTNTTATKNTTATSSTAVNNNIGIIPKWEVN